MKRKLLLLTIICSFSLISAIAQPKAIGGRLGTTTEVSYQHTMSSGTFIQADLGFPYYHGIQVSGVYNWIFATPNWTPKGTWEWYAGVGAGLGFSWNNYSRYDNSYSNYFYLGVAGMVGLSYTFWFPLQLSLDVKPIIGPKFSRFYDEYGRVDKMTTAAFNSSGLFDIALSVRYTF